VVKLVFSTVALSGGLLTRGINMVSQIKNW